jgi:hypothetical protein
VTLVPRALCAGVRVHYVLANSQAFESGGQWVLEPLDREAIWFKFSEDSAIDTGIYRILSFPQP